MPYLVTGDNGLLLDARLDLEGSSVILHSQGGSTGGRPPRNPGHGPALLAICRRSRIDDGSLQAVLIDSQPARKLPEARRVLIQRDEITTLDGDRLARMVRSRLRRFGQAEGVPGGHSTKQVRFDFNLDQLAIVRLLGLREGEFRRGGATPIPEVGLLTAEELRPVTALQIRRAVDRLLAGEDALNFAPSRDYDVLLPTGERLAPKKVFGLAVEQALGIEAFPGHFKAGWSERCFSAILEAGYDIVAKATASAAAPTPPGGSETPSDPDEKRWAEGSPRLAQHLRNERQRSRTAVAAKRAEVRAENDGRLACENPTCTADWYGIFPLAIAEAVFEVHHTILVSAMDQDHETSLGDLQCLCAACHRAEHRRLMLDERGRQGQ
ncbi:HNH endonuclease [Phenylobacterium sp.]|jgi:5-methylcytosine-specific restriction protein A|uniref:HNH endonuclease n=1 Tax=Phenylobacterium sp. TaxID=1871053 RepID=UPI002F92E114